MDDKQLLEAAARAAGELALLSHGKWNPLHSDADAFRLAVKLRIEIGYATMDGKHEFVTTQSPDIDGEFWEPIEADDLSATRRAIVRAAASLAKETIDGRQD